MFANAPTKQHVHRTISYFSYIHFLSLVHSVYYNMILIILISLFLVISSIIIVFNNNTVISNSIIDIDYNILYHNNIVYNHRLQNLKNKQKFIKPKLLQFYNKPPKKNHHRLFRDQITIIIIFIATSLIHRLSSTIPRLFVNQF